jgi:hypothetical protein
MSDTIICASCGKPGRADGMMRYETPEGETLAYWHSDCPTPPEVVDAEFREANEASEQVTALSAPVVPPPPIPTEILASALDRDRAVVELKKALHESQLRVKKLEADMALIAAGKDAAERCLREEIRMQNSLAKHGMLRIDRDWIALANELAALKNEPGLVIVDGVVRKMSHELMEFHLTGRA